MLINIRNIWDIIWGAALILLSVLSSVIISNTIIKYFLKDKNNANISLLLLFGHLLIIICFVILIRNILTRTIKDPEVLSGVMTITGPIIGASSLYLSKTLKGIVNYYE